MAQTIKLKRSATQGATPTTSQLALGEVAINTYDGKMYIKKDVGGTESIVEIGTSGGSGLASSFTLYEYTATANQTTFSGSDDNSNSLAYDADTPPKVLVYLNGVLLDFTTDYTATSGTSVVLTSATAAGDLVQVAAYKSTVSTTLDIDLTDNQKLLLGTDDDLEIFHNGTNSVINQTGTGDLLVQKDETTVAEFTVDGIVVTGDVEADEFIGDLRGAIMFKAQAGEALAKGDVVYISGISGNTTIVSKADADDASKMPAFGLAAAASTSGTTVEILTSGILSEVDTSAYSEGDELFVSTTAGALTATAPTGESSALQKIGKVTRSNNLSGSIFITGAGRSNAVPNLDDGDIFIGNSSNQAVTQSLTTASQNAGVLMDSEITNLAQVKAFDSSDYATAAQGTTADSALQNVVEDTSPQLGGNLDLNSNNITGTGNISNTGTITSSGNISGSNLNVTSTNWLGWGDYGERISGSNANSSLTFSTDATTALTLDSSQNATFVGTISSGAISVSSGADQILTLDQYTAGWNYIGFETSGTRKFYVGNGAGTEFVIGSDNSGVVLDISNFGSVDFNSANITAAGTISSGNITTSGYLAGPATFTIDPAAVGDNTGTVVIAGNLQVDGTTTTINSTTLTVDDKNITLASGSTNAAAANGAGITVDCGSDTDATLTYNGTLDTWEFNKRVDVTSEVRLFRSDGTRSGSILHNTSGTVLRTNSNGDNLYLQAAGTGNIYIQPTQTGYSTVVNEDGIDSDFRVESDGNTHAFFVDAGNSRIGINTSGLTADGLVIGTNNNNCELDLHNTGATGTRWRFNSTGNGRLQIENKTDSTIPFTILDSGNVGIGTTSPGRSLTVEGTSDAYIKTDATSHTSWTIGSDTYGFLVYDDDVGGIDGYRIVVRQTSGNVGVGTTQPQAKFQVEEAGIDTTTTSTSATTQVAIDSFQASAFRSARYTIQVTNSTDSTYHITEILLIHDGTTPQITEYGTIFTGSAEATFDADISSGNVRLLATPATTDSMTFKVVRHCITV